MIFWHISMYITRAVHLTGIIMHVANEYSFVHLTSIIKELLWVQRLASQRAAVSLARSLAKYCFAAKTCHRDPSATICTSFDSSCSTQSFVQFSSSVLLISPLQRSFSLLCSRFFHHLPLILSSARRQAFSP